MGLFAFSMSIETPAMTPLQVFDPLVFMFEPFPRPMIGSLPEISPSSLEHNNSHLF